MTGPQQPRAPIDPGHFGGRLRVCRLRACLTLQQVADVVGCTRGYLSAIEQRADGGSVGAYVLYAIARRLGTSVEYLLTGASTPPPAVSSSQRASIRTLYRAEVPIPEHIADREQFTTAYGRFRDSFSTLHGNAFTINTPLGLIEGFEATSRQDAEVFVSRWMERIADWQADASAPAP